MVLSQSHLLSVLQNDILLNSVNLVLSKKYEFDWLVQKQLCYTVVRHCMCIHFDSNTKYQLLMHSFYILLRISFETYIGEQLPEEIFSSAEVSLNFVWDEKNLIYGMLLMQDFPEMFGVGFSNKIGMQLEFLGALSSSLLLFSENIESETQFEKKSKIVSSAFERLAIEVRDTSMRLLSMVFSKVGFLDLAPGRDAGLDREDDKLYQDAVQHHRAVHQPLELRGEEELQGPAARLPQRRGHPGLPQKGPPGLLHEELLRVQRPGRPPVQATRPQGGSVPPAHPGTSRRGWRRT